MSEQQDKADKPSYGDRFPGGHDDKFFELFQKGVEMGTWNVEELIEETPVEEDREEWERMTHEQQLIWSHIVASFLDGEQNVAVDATKLVQMVDSPYIENPSNKEAFYTGLQFEEVKHAQFCAWYAENVVPDHVFSSIGRGSRHGLSRLGDRSKSDHFTERIEDILNTAIYTKKPHDIARAATNYGVFAEGTRARVRYGHMKSMAEETSLPTWLAGFEQISTDEGRHITGQVELIKGLVDKEKDGLADYQGIEQTILSQLREAISLLAKGAVGSVYQLQILKGERPTDEEFEQQVDRHIERRMRYLNDVFQETLSLPGYDEDEVRALMQESIAEIQDDIADANTFLATIERSQAGAQDLLEHENRMGFAGGPENER